MMQYVWVILLSLKAAATTTTTTTTTTTCPPPRAHINSRVELTNEEASYICDPGYTLFGSSTIQCKDGRWKGEAPVCATNIAYKRPANMSSVSRGSDPGKANDGHVTFLHEGQQCSVTLLEGSPWWRVDLLQAYEVVVVRVATRACCDTPPLKNLEIRVGNSTELQKNQLCAWAPGSVEEGVVKDFRCAIPLRGRYVSLQTVGSDVVLSLCEVEVYSTEEFSKERCSSEAELTSVGIFNKTCYEFKVKDGSTFDAAREKCSAEGSKSSPSDLVYGITEVIHDYLTSELDRRKADLKADLVWIGVTREPEFISRTWRWVDGSIVQRTKWGRAQPNNYNGKQNCVALDKGRRWLWNDVGCELDYLPSICQHPPRLCGSPDKEVNTTVTRTGGQTGSNVTYSCPIDSVLVGEASRTCLGSGVWSGQAPSCKYINCGPPEGIENGNFTYTSAVRNTYMASVTYTCALNYSMKGDDVRVCTEDAVWTPGTPTCLYSWCPELLPPPHGKVKVRGQRSGDIAEFACEEGYLLSGVKTVSCQLGGDWSSNSPSCEFVDCELPPDLPNGRVTLLNHTTHLGSLAAYACDPNHWLDGVEVRSCGHDGLWSDLDPACVLVTCGDPEVPVGGSVTGYSYNVGSQINYHCDPGYRMVLEEVSGGQVTEVKVKGHTRSCEITGLWSGSVPACLYTDCGHVPAPVKGSRDYLNGTTHLDSMVHYSCNGNYRIVGPEVRVCQEDSQWSGDAPLCQEIRCSSPPRSTGQGGAKLSEVTNTDRRLVTTFAKRREHVYVEDSYRIGSVAKYSCQKGYAIADGANRRCFANGTWSGDVPTCKYVDCGLPDKIDKGFYRLLSNTTHYGSQVSYQCVLDYRLDGRIRRICQANGTWAGLSPTCVEITCPDLTTALTPALQVTPSGRVRSGGVATYSCERGRRLVGVEARACTSTGSWNGSAPRCEWVSCQVPEDVPNGRTIRLNETLNYHTIVEVHCLPSHRLLGDFRRVCEENGMWSGPDPRCLAEGEENSINTILDDNSIGNEALDSTATTTTTTTTATNTGLYVGLVFGLLLCGLFVAILLLLRRRQRGGGGGKVQPEGGGGEERPPLPPPNDLKSQVNPTMTYSSITDPMTGNNIYENIDDKEEEEEEDLRGGGGGGGGGGHNHNHNHNNHNYNNYQNNNNYSNIPLTTTTTTTTTTTIPTTTTTIHHHSQPFYRPTTTISNSRRPRLPPPQPPTIPPSAVVTINGVTVNSDSG